jgi:2-dehydro-3-deoxyphosphogalactonate aldolase
MTLTAQFHSILAEMPLIAILRGLDPGAAEAVGTALVEAGIRLIEVPLNSPRPLDSIRLLRRRFEGQALVGAGTVLTEADADAVADAGGELIVAPNCEPGVIRQAVRRGCLAIPGILTPTEAFHALEAGAVALKIVPAEMAPPAVVKAMLAVLPPETLLLPVGGISAGNIAAYRAAGARGFGIGGSLYKPGDSADAVAAKAGALAAAVRAG